MDFLCNTFEARESYILTFAVCLTLIAKTTNLLAMTWFRRAQINKTSVCIVFIIAFFFFLQDPETLPVQDQ